MFLSRLNLNARDRGARRDLADCHALHRRLLSTFETGDLPAPRAELGLLHRLEHTQNAPVLYVQSGTKPDWSRLPPGYLLTDWLEAEPWEVTSLNPLIDGLSEGRRLRFRLRANVTRKVGTSPRGSAVKKNGRRIPVRNPDERMNWLSRRLKQAGATLVEGESGPIVRQAPTPTTVGRPVGRPALTFEGVDFDGYLRVMVPSALKVAVAEGIGPAKAFGFGLLSLAPVPE